MFFSTPQDRSGDAVNLRWFARGDVLLHRAAPALRRLVKERNNRRRVERRPAGRPHGGHFVGDSLQPLPPRWIAIHLSDRQPCSRGRQRKRGEEGKLRPKYLHLVRNELAGEAKPLELLERIRKPAFAN